MDKTARAAVLQELAAIRRLAAGIRERSGIPVVESCARWCETYARLAQWSLGEGERFEFIADQKETAEKSTRREPQRKTAKGIAKR